MTAFLVLVVGLSLVFLAVLGVAAWLVRGVIPPTEFDDYGRDELDDEDRDYLRRWTKH